VHCLARERRALAPPVARKSWDAICVLELWWLTSYTTEKVIGKLNPVELDPLALFIDTAFELIAMFFIAAPNSK
jgi:hypothetical protein